MLAEAFYWLVNMSFSATVMGGVVILVGKIKKLPRQILCALWIVPFVRAWVPVGIKSGFSLMSLVANAVAKTVTVFDGDIGFSAVNYIKAADSYFPIVFKNELLNKVFYTASVIWAVVALALMVAAVIIYFSAKSELSDAKPLGNGVFSSHKISSPAIYGVFRPKIILPEKVNKSDLKYILLHEKCHIKRLDNLWRVAAVITACLHWFNPFLWLLLKLFFEALELACDEAVIKKCNITERKEYARALLNSAESKSLYISAFGGARIRTRIKRIVSYKKLSLLSLSAFITMALAVTFALLTN